MAQLDHPAVNDRTCQKDEGDASSSLKARIQCCGDRADNLIVEQEQLRKQIDLLQEQLATAIAFAGSSKKKRMAKSNPYVQGGQL